MFHIHSRTRADGVAHTPVPAKGMSSAPAIGADDLAGSDANDHFPPATTLAVASSSSDGEGEVSPIAPERDGRSVAPSGMLGLRAHTPWAVAPALSGVGGRARHSPGLAVDSDGPRASLAGGSPSLGEQAGAVLSS